MKSFTGRKFDTTKAGQDITVYTLENENGMKVSVLDYGMRIQSLYVPDEDGDLVNVVMGFDSMPRYEGGGCYGALIGRFANRIKDAKFQLNGKEVQLTVNDHTNYIHGNFEHTVFTVEASDSRLTGTYLSPDGEFGFPGNLSVKVIYELTEDNELILTYEAVTDAPTVVNITNHTYLNLDGMPENADEVTKEAVNIIAHKMTINADAYLEADDINMVTGKVIPVEGTDFDFRTEREIGGRLYDHNFNLNGYDGTLKKAVELTGPGSGIKLELWTTQPGVQVYTGAGKAVALETQHYPDGPNHPEWPDTTLLPGGTYREQTVYKFV